MKKLKRKHREKRLENERNIEEQPAPAAFYVEVVGNRWKSSVEIGKMAGTSLVFTESGLHTYG
ncbi:hypothetical protein CHL76_07335 [Marinococcus halophilus]|uniref:Uncharacterized protein n=1 Tax=Marinococcus halophilus TaxID=1371 RepID=A0A510Y4Y2_MARHA|nr:hypothetical protein [Marinococcus halophilus]OZT80336.1 hypothetical protein CHL76_07335 [Marinococcus halophilus]GEK58394.1 hypothetical protein MHA01_12990 [Marinococcus halophilus]